MIPTFQRNRHFSKVLLKKTFTHVQEQKKAMLPRHSAYIPSSVKSPLLQGHLEYVMHTFELKSPEVSISLRFPIQIKTSSRSRLFSFRLLAAPANCLETV